MADGGDEAALGGNIPLGGVAGLGELMLAPELAAIGAGASVRDRKDNHRKKHDRQETGAQRLERHTVREHKVAQRHRDRGTHIERLAQHHQAIHLVARPGDIENRDRQQ